MPEPPTPIIHPTATRSERFQRTNGVPAQPPAAPPAARKPKLKKRISAEDAVSMIVNGFCKQVFKELPMEFAVEAQKLLTISLEGTVG